ncbi:GDNF family receptor alpha-1-like [Pantherophis guttatus]|uniref:GDNF family receptor alpha-1-like n=1 Tax=Pantherophis guttatus TaxID=94885 RepID=A0A6P9DPR7_PANGU|nr:GDNF family receptor alpha-1-like [Pantherophis guttatus]XP_060544447.1 GDNF family receptor alpha-1-like [Pantherophis guttatus]
MGLPLLLGLLLSGGFQVMSFEQPNNCLTAETLCLAEPSCSTNYQILQNCSQHLSKNGYIFLYHEAKDRCTEAQIKMRNSHFQHCKCHQRAQKKEERCLQIYRAVYSTLTQDDFHLEVLPHRDIANKEAVKIKYNKLATRVSGSHRTKNRPNSCVLAANTCQLDHKCMRHRSQYAQACTTGYPCDQRACHRNLRYFFEKIGVEFTKRLLFCPCQDEACGERRWQTIVPQCSFLSSSKPNCLLLLDACVKDNTCRSRLAGFQEKCKPLQALTDSCSPLNYAACLQAYMKMIGTSLTPNYVSNSSTEITLWCSCTNSGNHKEDCDQILNLFSSNKCLNNAIQAQMNLGQKNKDQPQFTPSLDIQGDGTSTMFTEKLYQEPEVKEEKKDSEILTLNQESPPNSEYPRAQFSSLILILTLVFLFLGPP